jgi:hypothetical protein
LAEILGVALQGRHPMVKQWRAWRRPSQIPGCCNNHHAGKAQELRNSQKIHPSSKEVTIEFILIFDQEA